MQKRIRWKTTELVMLGMEIDRLKALDSSKLVPTEDLLRLYAQNVLPMERRRDLSVTESKDVVARIDAMRHEQAVNEMLGIDVESAPLPRPILPEDSEEAKRFAAVFIRVEQSEKRIMDKLEEMFASQLSRIERMVDMKLQRHLLETIELITDGPVQQQAATVNPVKQQPKVAVVFPQEASWAAEVPSCIKALKGERLQASPIALGKDIGNFSITGFDYLIVVDSASESPAAGIAMHRTVELCRKVGFDLNKVKQVRCATRDQIMTHVKFNMKQFMLEVAR
jgi:hypothetical protein